MTNAEPPSQGRPAQHPYEYPDDGDRVTLAIMAQSDLSPEQWEYEESAVLEHIDAIILEGPRDRLLDYGSGLGRLALRYAATFDHVASYEPDLGRANMQRDHVAADEYGARVQVASDPSELGADFDAAVCSHVIQHVPTDVVTTILGDITGRLRRGGHLLLITTLSADPNPRFVVGRFSDAGRAVEDAVSQETFNETLRGSPSGQLPVHFFPYADLIEILDEQGMDLVVAYAFHGTVGVVGPLLSAAAEVVGCRDVAVLARRR